MFWTDHSVNGSPDNETVKNDSRFTLTNYALMNSQELK